MGVTTAGSIIHDAFPLWLPLLGVDARLASRDLALGASPSEFVRLVEELRSDPALVGAVVTTHKVALFDAAADHFDSLDGLARECGEINAIRSRHNHLVGFARDPVSVGRVVDRIWPAGDAVICLGAGGTAIALGRHLLSRRVPPTTLAFADPDPQATARLRRLLSPSATARGVAITTYLGSEPWDDLLASNPAGSLIVNATGLGKDRPGSPISSDAAFPRTSTIWELNYRGELSLLAQARAQARAQGLDVHDGWELFCHGWAAGLTAVFNLPGDSDLGNRLAEAAAGLRPPP